LSFIPAIALADCSTWVTVADVGGTISAFGWAIVSGDTMLARAGNSFLMDCNAQLGEITVMVRRPTVVNRDIEPLAAGDHILCEIFDENKNFIMAATGVVPDTGLLTYVTFTFWDREFALNAGLYRFMLSPVEPKYGNLVWGNEYADGAYQEDWLGYWLDYASRDAVFHAVWDPNSTFVATQTRSFGTVKALYRQ
jgi:hypothetical protein